MSIPALFRTAIIECIQGNFKASELQSLSIKYPMGITFDESRRLNENYLESSETFVVDVIGRGHVYTLIKAISAERPNLESAARLVQSFTAVFMYDNKRLRYQPGPFQ